MSDNFEEKYDKRTYERHLDEGTITREQIDEYLESLPDLADEAEELEAEFEEGVLEDDEEEAEGEEGEDAEAEDEDEE